MVETTSRTIGERFLLRPGSRLNERVIGVLARAQQYAGIEIYGVDFQSGLSHLDVGTWEARKLLLSSGAPRRQNALFQESRGTSIPIAPRSRSGLGGSFSRHLLPALQSRAEGPMAFDYRDRLERNPRIAGGEAVFKGTRVTLRTVLASLAEGATVEEILNDFPTLGGDDLRAAIAFAAASAQEDLPVAEVHVR
jgi:uncharacterized protein (DUF433 family)